jgi:hypothetical protein
MIRRERGVTFLGWLILIAPIALLVYVGIRLGPVYLDHSKLVRVLDQTQVEFSSASSVTRAALKTSLERRLEIEYLSVPTVDDLDIRRENNGWVIEAAYERRIPILSNVTALLDFDHSVTIP